MVPQGSPSPLGGAQPGPPTPLRSNSGSLSGQGSGMPSHNPFLSPHNQFNNMNMLGNAVNVSSLLQNSLGNGGQSSGLSVLGKRRLVENGAESDPFSGVANGTGINTYPYMCASVTTNPNSSGQVQGQQQQFPNASGNQILADQLHTQQLDTQYFQHNQKQLQQFSVPGNQQQRHTFDTERAELGGVGPVKLETQAMNDQTPQQLQALRNLGTVKSQQMQSMRSLAPVKMESQQPEPSFFLNQQQQQLLLRQSSQAAAGAQMLHQQRLMQIQHQQQQRDLKPMPQQKSQLLAQFQPQNLPIRSSVKQVYEPGMCAKRLTHYMHQQQQRPEDNNIEFWRKFVAENFAPNAKKKWCISMYASGRQTTGVFPQDVWNCEICNRKSGRGYEATAEVLPRLFKIKFESGTMEELLYVDMPKEYQNSSGQIVLDYAKAIQESIFEQLHVVRDGQLRIIFSPDLKICSWEFCARRHEELVPKRLLIPQVSQLGAAAQKYQAATQNTSDVSVSELQNNCNMFVSSARQLTKALEAPLVNDVGYTKRYVRCLQISEVVNSMKDLIDYSSESHAGPMESLAKYPRLNPPPDFLGEPQQLEGRLQQQQQQQQQIMVQNSNDDGSVRAVRQQIASTNGGMLSVSNTLNSVPVTSSAGTKIGLVHQNSMNFRRQNMMSNINSPYRSNNVQLPSPVSSNTMPQPQTSTPFQSPMPSSSNNPLQQTSHCGLSGAHTNLNSPNISMQQPALPGDADANDSQSSVKFFLEEMMSSQLGGSNLINKGTVSNDAKNVNVLPSSNNNSGLCGRNGVVGNRVANGNLSIGGVGFGTMGNGLGQSVMANGIHATLDNNSMTMDRRAGMTVAQEQSMNRRQQDLGNQLLGGLGAANGFNDLQFNWKPSP
ncbi:transcriptional corepressor SEUSS-like isoform X2 [Olea europaea var. sylvestris]|uniref:transcriptional corepressor SEUSS-like isoform X2 n=1 Tax=Olea europaea var. sylvestris TaxID=158386 RepID=UPI000C1D4760|nr:transcriptional corepressor SEUSS-like isoform X2 [Olea europaea var. sylvestris]